MNKRTIRKTKNVFLIKIILTIIALPKLLKFNRKSRNVLQSQEKFLFNLLNQTKNTLFGKRHNFKDIKTISDYQKFIPIHKYEDLSPYILSHTNGESNILFPGKPLLYATTSGTTGSPKWIPITEEYSEECYTASSHIWLYSLLKSNPHIYDGPELSIVGSKIEGTVADGTSFGSLSGHVYEQIPPIFKKLHICPNCVFKIADYRSRYYTIMRLTIEYYIKLLITANPSTLIELNNITNERFEEIATDIERGTLSAELKLEPSHREEIENLLTPNPIRATELRKLMQEHKTLYPKHYWPTLEIVNTWRSGNSGLYLERTKNYFSKSTVIREFGYQATEARAGIVLENHALGSILACHQVFFEFIKVVDKEMSSPPIYLANELEIGVEYYLIITASNGMYRYDINDILRVEGFYNQFPIMIFVQKGAGVTNMTGEKLSEKQLIEAVSLCSEHIKLYPVFFVAFADIENSCYRYFVEFEIPQSKDFLENYRSLLDNFLKNLNLEYKAKSDSLRLKPLVLHVLKPDAFRLFKDLCESKDLCKHQFKLSHLSQDTHRMSMFQEISTELKNYH